MLLRLQGKIIIIASTTGAHRLPREQRQRYASPRRRDHRLLQTRTHTPHPTHTPSHTRTLTLARAHSGHSNSRLHCNTALALTKNGACTRAGTRRAVGAGRTLQANLALRHLCWSRMHLGLGHLGPGHLGLGHLGPGHMGRTRAIRRAQRANTLRSVGAGLICRQLAIATLGLVGAEQQIGALGSKLDLVGAPC